MFFLFLFFWNVWNEKHSIHGSYDLHIQNSFQGDKIKKQKKKLHSNSFSWSNESWKFIQDLIKHELK